MPPGRERAVVLCPGFAPLSILSLLLMAVKPASNQASNERGQALDRLPETGYNGCVPPPGKVTGVREGNPMRAYGFVDWSGDTGFKYKAAK